MKTFGIALLALSLTCSAASGEEPKLPKWVTDSGSSWQPPRGGVVRDGRAAITIAHAIWLSLHPDLRDRMGDENAWQKIMAATLSDGVWQVTAARNSNDVGGGAVYFHRSKRWKRA
jgi:hypothetical protein